MHSIVRGTGTPKDRASYILFEYIDPAEVGADISLAEVGSLVFKVADYLKLRSIYNRGNIEDLLHNF